MQVEYYKSIPVKRSWFGFDLDFRDWGMGIVFSFYNRKPYASIQIGPLTIFVGVE